jgi:hypothetical protein
MIMANHGSAAKPCVFKNIFLTLSKKIMKGQNLLIDLAKYVIPKELLEDFENFLFFQVQA